MSDLIHMRKPWLAALMSFVLPGFGQLYNGEVNKAVWLFLGFAFVSIPLFALVAIYLPDALLIPTLVLATLCGIGLWLYATVDAWRRASGLQHYRLPAWQTSGLYVLTLVLCAVFALPLLYGYVRSHLVEPFRIPSASMAPGIISGDFLIADKRYNCPGCKLSVRRGDIAIFTYPNDRSFNYIKRIIGLPGDRVEIRGRDIVLNGKSLKLSETSASDGYRVREGWEGRSWTVQWTQTDKTAPDADFTVPPGQVLVLGDNRNLTKDSRAFGTVPLQDVVGQARQIWLSWDAGPRWARIGRVLQ